MSPKDFFYDFVMPNLEEFGASPTDKRLAANAAVAMYHMIDYVADSRLPKTGRKREVELGIVKGQVIQSCPHFKLVDDLAHAYKHCFADLKPRTFYNLLRVQTHIGSAFADGTYYADRSSSADMEQVVAVQDANGRWIDLRHCLEAVRRYWDRYLKTGKL